MLRNTVVYAITMEYTPAYETTPLPFLTAAAFYLLLLLLSMLTGRLQVDSAGQYTCSTCQVYDILLASVRPGQ
jgi:hypothetical protein